MKLIQEAIEEGFPEGISETTLNDMLWFDDEYILTEILGIDIEDFYKRPKN